MSTVRGSLGRLAISSSNNNNCLGKIVISSSPFSTFSGGGGGGRGRGRGGSFGLPNPQLGAGKSEADDDNGEVDQFPSGLGHGRGKPIPSNPVLPAFSSWMSGINPSVGRGRTIQQQQQQQPGSSSHESQSFQPKKPIFFSREESSESAQNSQFDDLGRDSDGSSLLSSLSSGLPGAGRGKPIKLPVKEERPKEENRHIRPRQPGPGSTRGVGNESEQRSSRPSSPRLSREDAVKNAVGILSRGGGGGGGLEEGGRGAGFRGRGTRGGGRGRGFRGRGRGFQGRGGRGAPDKDDDFDSGLYLGDNADGEKLASKLGADNMNKLVEGFEEMSSRVLPSPMDDAYLDALHTNNLVSICLISSDRHGYGFL